MEIETTSILSLFETNKAQRKSFVSDLLSRIDTGGVNPIKVHLQLKCMSDIIKQVQDDRDYKDMLLTEVEKTKNISLPNANIEIRETGVKWHYENCNDAILNDLHQQLNELQERIKGREKFLQTLPDEGLIITDKETGETTQIHKPYKTSTTGVVVTLK